MQVIPRPIETASRILPMHVYRSKSGNYSVKLRMFARDFRIGANYAQPKDASEVAKNAFLHCRVSQQGILSLSKEVSKAGIKRGFESRNVKRFRKQECVIRSTKIMS